MLSTQGYAAVIAKAALQPFVFERRDVGPHDVLIAITYCGICHSDIHQARDEWGDSIFPMVPGHEIVGTITAVGNAVKQFHVGETAGVGCFVDSCRSCHACVRGWSNIVKPACSSRIVASTKTVGPRKGATRRRLSWMRTICCESLRSCRLQGQLHFYARELPRTPRCAIGA